MNIFINSRRSRGDTTVGLLIVIGILFLIGAILGAMWAMPNYNVYSQRLEGQALLAHAQSAKEVAVAEAKAKMESASLLADAEVARAKGVAAANKIIGESLQGNNTYLDYLWITEVAGHGTGREVIYVPTGSVMPNFLEPGALVIGHRRNNRFQSPNPNESPGRKVWVSLLSKALDIIEIYDNFFLMKIEYRKTELTPGEAIIIEPFWHPTIDAWNPLYKDIKEPFDLHKFTCPRLPISLGPLDVKAMKACPSVLRVPIKKPIEHDVIRLPKELLPIKDILIRLLQYDRHIFNVGFEHFHAHITIDNSIVKPNTTQRFGGFHGDGLQGGKFKQKLLVEHSYIFTDKFPTEVALQPFFVAHLNEDRYNIFKEFDKQVKRDLIYHLRPGHVYLIDPYVVHASPVITQKTERTFFRLTLTPAELLMPKNTINPMFGGQKYDARIDVRDFVADPDVAIPFDFYGIEK